MVAVYYDLSYGASAYDFPTTRKAVWIADSLISNPIPGIELEPPPPLTEDDLLTVHGKTQFPAEWVKRRARPVFKSSHFDQWRIRMNRMVLHSRVGSDGVLHNRRSNDDHSSRF